MKILGIIDIVELSDEKMGIYGNTDGEWMCKWMKNNS